MRRHRAGPGTGARSRPSPCRGPARKDEHRRQLERLRAELEAERLRSRELCRRFVAETHEMMEAAERDRQLLAKRLRSQLEQQQARELRRLRELNRRQREVEIRQLLSAKEAELHEVQEVLQQQRDAAVRQARDLQQQLAKELVRGASRSGEAPVELQDVLSKLRWETKSKEAARILRLQDELLLQRRLFLKYLLERVDGEQPASCEEAKASAWHRLQTLLGTGAIGSSESLLASSSRDGEGQRKTHTRLQEEGNSTEALLEAAGQDSTPRCSDSPPQGTTRSGPSVAEVGVQTVGQREDWLPGSSHSRLQEQHAHLQRALKDLERRCRLLQEENCLPRKASSPEEQEKRERIKQKTARLRLLAKQLQETARQLEYY